MSISTEAQSEMPRYRSHKTVWALAIDHIESVDGMVRLHFEDADVQPLMVEADVVHRFLPKKGDYYIVYADGYQSVSPKKAFEEGYTLMGPYEKE